MTGVYASYFAGVPVWAIGIGSTVAVMAAGGATAGIAYYLKNLRNVSKVTELTQSNGNPTKPKKQFRRTRAVTPESNGQTTPLVNNWMMV